MNLHLNVDPAHVNAVIHVNVGPAHVNVAEASRYCQIYTLQRDAELRATPLPIDG